MNQFEQLKTMTTVVADTGDMDALSRFRPQDATTNPSLILKAAQTEANRPFLLDVIKRRRQGSVADWSDDVLVAFGQKILSIIPGRVSTEVDAHLSFDTDATVKKAKHLIGLYEKLGVSRTRVLIKIAATWEGIQAAAILEKEGIHCNMTLLFCLEQAVACARARVQLISPFVGRIYDWYKHATGIDYSAENDPGVLFVKAVYHAYKQYGIQTEIMGASFRNIGQILALAGCDLLTISPDLLQQLSQAKAPIARQLSPNESQAINSPWIDIAREADFRLACNNQAMAVEKLSEGIRLFCADTMKLQTLLGSIAEEK